MSWVGISHLSQSLRALFDSLQYLLVTEKLVLIGDEPSVLRKLKEMQIDLSLFDVVHTSQVIEMADHPAKAFSQKKDSSIAVGYEMLKNGDLDGFCSAGNTGAMLVGASYTVNVIPGVLRPALATVLPCIDNRSFVLLDVGLNPDCNQMFFCSMEYLAVFTQNAFWGKIIPLSG